MKEELILSPCVDDLLQLPHAPAAVSDLLQLSPSQDADEDLQPPRVQPIPSPLPQSHVAPVISPREAPREASRLMMNQVWHPDESGAAS